MHWSCPHLLTVIFMINQSVVGSFHAQLPRSKGSRIKSFNAVLKVQELKRGLNFENHENVQRRINQETLQELKQLLLALQEQEDEPETNEDESPVVNSEIFAAILKDGAELVENDPYDDNGMIYLTKPKFSQQRLVNRALNKASILLEDPTQQQELTITPSEMKILREMLEGEERNLEEEKSARSLRGGIEEGAIARTSQNVFRFNDLVA